MFFSTELLSKRDSGYGLLWLAATLGSKSKKLPRRSVLTADIQQLCGLVSEPPEPLALRLSSNLMVGVVRVYKMKHEIFQTDVGNCFTSLKKTLQELHTMSESLDMAQPNGLREDALNMVIEPGAAMETEFDVNYMDWDIVFRKIENDAMIDNEFNPDPPAKSSSFIPAKRNLHQLDESHEHLLSASFFNSLSGDVEPGANDGPSSSANNMLFDLDFGGDPEVGLGEEMERELEEAWNLKPLGDEGEAADPVQVFDFGGIQMDIDHRFGGDIGGGMDFSDGAFGAGLGQDHEFNDEGPILGQQDDERIHLNGSGVVNQGADVLHSPPPHDKAPHRSCLSRRNPDVQDDDRAAESQTEPGKKTSRSKKPRKKVILVDPRIELSDEQLKFQRDNYLVEMGRLRREAQRKKELKDGKRRYEEMLWAPPKDFIAPELIEWYNQRVVYPVKAREAAWRKELEEQQPPKKKRHIERQPFEKLDGESVQDPSVKDVGNNFPVDVDMDPIGGIGDVGWMDAFEYPAPAQGDPPSGSHRSSESPGNPRRGSPRPESPLQTSLLGRGDLDKSDQVSNSLFPWDHAGPSSSNAALPGSFGFGSGGSDLGLSRDSVIVKLKRSSRSGSASDSPLGHAGNLLEGADVLNAEGPVFEFNASIDDANLMETQESESMVTLEKNSFNFLGYAKMHTVSSSKPLFFSDLVPTDSSSVRVAAEGFYHCLALATKDLIRLEQKEAYGPIEIQMK